MDLSYKVTFVMKINNYDHISKVAKDKINELVYDSWDRAYEELGT